MVEQCPRCCGILKNHLVRLNSLQFFLQGFHVENAVCGGCHTMVHARPDPSYNESPNDPIYANGHEEINLEARRRHRQEKQPPLEDDSEKILTIEQAQVDQEGEQEQINPQDNQTEDNNNQNQDQDQPQQPQTKGQKISTDMLHIVGLNTKIKMLFGEVAALFATKA